jgi:hypothetical protein
MVTLLYPLRLALVVPLLLSVLCISIPLMAGIGDREGREGGGSVSDMEIPHNVDTVK